MTANSEARKRTDETVSDPNTFGVYFDRREYRDFTPSPRNVQVHRCLHAPRAHYWDYDAFPNISVSTAGATARFSGPLDNLRATLDALELAYDRLVNPPAPTNPHTSGRSMKWTGD